VTTVVATPIAMAIDSAYTDDKDCSTILVEKVAKLDDCYVAFAGDVDSADRVIEWMRAGCTGRRPVIGAKHDTEFLILHYNGQLFYMGRLLRRVRVKEGFAAIGSGGQTALAELRRRKNLGKRLDVKAAVELAILGDPGSKGPVQRYYVRDLAANRRAIRARRMPAPTMEAPDVE
jgi:hypothetical protein